MNLFCNKTKSAYDVDSSHNKLIDAKFIEVKKRMGGTGANSVNSCWIAEDLLWMRMVACTELILEQINKDADPPEPIKDIKDIPEEGQTFRMGKQNVAYMKGDITFEEWCCFYENKNKLATIEIKYEKTIHNLGVIELFCTEQTYPKAYKRWYVMTSFTHPILGINHSQSAYGSTRLSAIIKLRKNLILNGFTGILRPIK